MGQLAEDLFSLDNGAIFGLEYRFGITSDLQAGVHRSLLSKTIQVFGRYDAWKQGDKLPVSISVLASIEGLNNLQEDMQPGIVATVSRAVDNWLVLYASPGFVGNTHAADFIEGHDDHELPGVVDEHANHDNTAFIGLGGRVRASDHRCSSPASSRRASLDTIRVTASGRSRSKNVREGAGTHCSSTSRTRSARHSGKSRAAASEHNVYLGFNITRKF